MELGKRLQLLRKKKGLSQEELAQMLSVTRQTVSKWELGQSEPDLQFVSRLSEIFGVTTDYLIKGDVDDPDKTAENTGGEADSAPPSEVAAKEAGAHSRFLNFLGSLMAAFGSVIVVVFVVLSCENPWDTWNEHGYFTGLLGYLYGTGTMPYFIIGLVLLIAGIVIYGISVRRNCH